MGNIHWIDDFLDYYAEHTAPDFSNHRAGILSSLPQKRKSSFKKFNFLTKNRDFLNTVQNNWISSSVYGTSMY